MTNEVRHCGEWCRECEHEGDVVLRWFDFGEKAKRSERFYVNVDGGTRKTFALLYRGSDMERAASAYAQGQEIMASTRAKAQGQRR